MSEKRRNQTDKQTKGLRGFKTPIHIATIPPQPESEGELCPPSDSNFLEFMGLLCFLSLIELIKLMLTSSPNYQLLCCAMRYAPCPAIISYESAWLNSSDFPTLSPSQLLNFLTSIFSHFLLFCSSALLIFLTSYPLTHRLTLSPTFRYELSASSPSGFQASQLFFCNQL